MSPRWILAVAALGLVARALWSSQGRVPEPPMAVPAPNSRPLGQDASPQPESPPNPDAGSPRPDLLGGGLVTSLTEVGWRRYEMPGILGLDVPPGWNIQAYDEDGWWVFGLTDREGVYVATLYDHQPPTAYRDMTFREFADGELTETFEIDQPKWSRPKVFKSNGMWAARRDADVRSIKSEVFRVIETYYWRPDESSGWSPEAGPPDTDGYQGLPYYVRLRFRGAAPLSELLNQNIDRILHSIVLW